MAEKKLKILLVGASGVLGRAVAAELAQRHEVVTAGRSSGDLRLDLTDPAAIEKALDDSGPFDAVASATGKVNFLPLSEMRPARTADSAYFLGLDDKVMGQVNLALAAMTRLTDGGSITLTTGILSKQPIAAGTSAAMANGAVEAFVRAAAIELPRGLRINVVSPTVLTEAMAAYGPFFRGFEPVSAARAALAFSRSIEGLQTGQVYRVGW